MWQWIKKTMGFKGKTTTSGTAASVPTGLALSVVSSSAITATWNASTGSPTGYEVQIATDAAFVTATSYTLGLVLTKAFTGLTASTTYYVRVRSLKTGSPNSAWASGVSATTSAAAPPSITVFDMVNGTASGKPGGGGATPMPNMTRAYDENESLYYAVGTGSDTASRQAASIDTARITTIYAARTDGIMRLDDIEAIMASAYYASNAASVQAKFGQIDAAAYAGNSTIARGFYNGNPQLDWVNTQPYQRTHSPSSTYYANWKTRNAAMAAATPHVSFYTLKMYVQYEPGVGAGGSKTLAQVQNEWDECANEMYANAVLNNSGGKPIYLLIWPKYVPTVGIPTSGAYIPTSFWRHQLDWAKAKGISIIIWGDATTTFGDWYTETQSFIASL